MMLPLAEMRNTGLEDGLNRGDEEEMGCTVLANTIWEIYEKSNGHGG